MSIASDYSSWKSIPARQFPLSRWSAFGRPFSARKLCVRVVIWKFGLRTKALTANNVMQIFISSVSS